eukprot:scaffold268421_cov31-Tisochrysis_lutea.AAC.3
MASRGFPSLTRHACGRGTIDVRRERRRPHLVREELAVDKAVGPLVGSAMDDRPHLGNFGTHLRGARGGL